MPDGLSNTGTPAPAKLKNTKSKKIEYETIPGCKSTEFILKGKKRGLKRTD